MLILLALFLLFSLSTQTATKTGHQHTGTQSYRVTGRFFCGDEPASNVLVKLIDDDFGPDQDDDLNVQHTDKEGRFTLSGFTKEVTTIDPHLRIYHDCNDGIKPCQRRWKFELPNKYISGGEKPEKTLNIGTWNLEMLMRRESHDSVEKKGKILLLPFLLQPIFASPIDIAPQHTGTQSYKVSGKLFCGNQPATDVLVRLIDEDFGRPDDVLANAQTDSDGRFSISGFTSEITTIDPMLEVYHDCNDGIIPCQRRWRFELPNKYITSGPRPDKEMDIGAWNLEAIVPKEKHDCIH